MPEPTLEQPVQFLKGVGEKRAALYRKLGVETYEDLLGYYPRAYIDFSRPYGIDEAPDGETCAVRATVVKKSAEQHIRRGLSLFKVLVTDGALDMTITFFNTKFLVDSLKLDEEYLFYGRASRTLTKVEMASPMVLDPRRESPISPVYPLTQGLSSKLIAVHVRNALTQCELLIEEPLTQELRERLELCHKGYAVENIHFPADQMALETARRRLIFEELFTLSLGLSLVKTDNSEHRPVPMKNVSLKKFYKALPFTLTGAQQRVIGEACGDMVEGTRPMNRLIQGDVGSGKTAVAAACAYFAHKNGLQTVMMAPTELLAQQHCATLTGLLAPLGLRVGLLTGSMRAKEKREVKQALAEHAIDFIVGTHALIEDSVVFDRLGLVVTDEQHRFGVAQRMTLAQKGENPHVMVMSATPIPRTLAYIIYGDLEVSVIDELPKNRIPICTYLIDEGKLQRAYGFLRKHLDEGMQAYIVCPLVEESEVDDSLRSAVAYAQSLSEGPFDGYRVQVLHGKMKPSEKERVMLDFKEGTIQLLVSTTVVEVGVDVPNAVVMMIVNADRFGLSQLHQLRGRVGRGGVQSHCILVSNSRNPMTRQRLKMICSSTDGFKISEFDLKLRGPGDFFGFRQHGLPTLKIADMLGDTILLELSQQEARRLLAEDPLLEQPGHALLRRQVSRLLEYSVG